MSITKLKNILLGATVLLFMIAALFTSQSVSANDNLPNFHRWYLQFGFDVAEIGSRFV